MLVFLIKSWPKLANHQDSITKLDT